MNIKMDESKILSDFCDSIKGLVVYIDQHRGIVDITLDYIILDSDKLSYQTIEILRCMIEDLIYKYSPKLRVYNYKCMGEVLKGGIEQDIKYEANQIIAEGGRTIQDEFRYRLGFLL